MKAALSLLAASLVLLSTGAGGARMLDSTGSHTREFPPVLVAGTDSGPGLLPTAFDPCQSVNCRGDRECRIVGAKGVCRCPLGLKPKFRGSSDCVDNPCYNVTCKGTKVCRNPGGVAKCMCKSWQGEDPDNSDLCIAKSQLSEGATIMGTTSNAGDGDTTTPNKTSISLVTSSTTPPAATSPPGGASTASGTDTPGTGTSGVPTPSPKQGNCPDESHAESVGGVPVCVCNDVDSSWVAGKCKTGKVAFAQYLEPHNQLRAALGLDSLTWSTKVAAHAQKWAERIRDDFRCKPQHPSGKEGENYPYGQNLVWGGGMVDSTAVNEWVKEGKNWDNSLSPDGCVKGPTKSWADCGHYTQVAWRSTTSLGCGKVECSAGTVWVCEYDPPGNWMGEKPY